MKTLLAVMSYKGGDATCARHWPYFLETASAIVGIGHEDTHCEFPKDKLIRTFNIGKDGYANGTNHIERFLKTLEVCSHLNYDRVIVTEYDSIFTGYLSEKYGTTIGPIAGTHSGYRSEGFHSSFFFHAPWAFSPEMLHEIVHVYGPRMLAADLIEHGFIDRFLGLMVDLYGLPFTPIEKSYSRNTILPEHYGEVREAVLAGCPFLHGVKSSECLDVIKAALSHVV